ncbi:probable G-protein coupled receptor 25 [Salvelinus fontinalis]|uniref:probable G-protein coupled receptor 25 n=1 Tax=Salvelinus fontinalis TaxID=8038 RepID=UPI0024861D94|nr:probable G-protein coupled receptor 25 [Salvelinus fontinalis]
MSRSIELASQTHKEQAAERLTFDHKMETYDSDKYFYSDDMLYNVSYDLTYLGERSSSSLPYSHIYLPLLYFLMFFTGFLGNLFVITVMGSRRKRGGRLVDTFVVNLALADLVFVLTLPLWAVSSSQEGHWPFGNLLCKLSSYIVAVNRFSNIFFLTCMSVDRHLAVVGLMDSRFLRSSQCVRLNCAVVWLLSLALGTPSLVYRSTYTPNGKLFCLEDEESSFFLGLSLTMVFLTFALPVLIIILCYGSILAHLRQHCVAAGNPRAEARRRHSLKMVFTIIVAFVVSWLPFNIFKTILIGFRLSRADLSLETQSVLSQGLTLSCCLAFLNSCMNPAIYLFLDHHFRGQAENQFLSCVGKLGLHQGYASSTDFYNGTSESCGTTASRTRLQPLDQDV